MYKPVHSPKPSVSALGKSRRHFVCDHPDCENKPDCPMLHEELWWSISHERGLLCIEHTEQRLGRQLTIEDLSDCVGNAFTFLLWDRVQPPTPVYERFRDGTLKPFLEPERYDELRDDDRFLYNRGPKPEGLT